MNPFTCSSARNQSYMSSHLAAVGNSELFFTVEILSRWFYEKIEKGMIALLLLPLKHFDFTLPVLVWLKYLPKTPVTFTQASPRFSTL